MSGQRAPKSALEVCARRRPAVVTAAELDDGPDHGSAEDAALLAAHAGATELEEQTEAIICHDVADDTGRVPTV